MSLTDATNLMTEEELADYIHELADILHGRLRGKPRDGSWLKRQVDNARIKVRSWPTWRQNASRGMLGRAGH